MHLWRGLAIRCVCDATRGANTNSPMSGLERGCNVLRAKTYANKADKEVGKIGHLQISGPLADFEEVMKDADKQKALFDEIRKTIKAVG